MIVVSDTSPVSALLRIGHCDLLERLYGRVIIPEAVETELRRRFDSLPDFSIASKSATMMKSGVSAKNWIWAKPKQLCWLVKCTPTFC